MKALIHLLILFSLLPSFVNAQNEQSNDQLIEFDLAIDDNLNRIIAQIDTNILELTVENKLILDGNTFEQKDLCKLVRESSLTETPILISSSKNVKYSFYNEIYNKIHLCRDKMPKKGTLKLYEKLKD